MVIGYRLYNKAASPKQVSAEAKNLLLQLVRTYWSADTPPQHISVDKDSSGAPVLTVDGQPLCCSLTHKSGCIAAAFSATTRIGIDLENLNTDKTYQRIRNAYRHGFLADTELTRDAFFYRWTLAEAFAKASGIPLLEVLEKPLKEQQASAKYFQIRSFLLCAYQASLPEKSREITLHHLEADNQRQ